MNRLRFALGLLFLLLFLVVVVPSRAGHCGVVAVRQVHAPVVHHAHQVYAATFVALPVAIPSYGVGYDNGAQGQALQLEMLKLNLEIQKLRLQQPASAPATAPQKAATTAPTAAPTAAIGDVLSKCTSCHDAAVAKAKGNGFVLVEGDRSRALSAEEAFKVLRQVRSGAMPPGKPLSDPEKTAVTDWVIGGK